MIATGGTVTFIYMGEKFHDKKHINGSYLHYEHHTKYFILLNTR